MYYSERVYPYGLTRCLPQENGALYAFFINVPLSLTNVCSGKDGFRSRKEPGKYPDIVMTSHLIKRPVIAENKEGPCLLVFIKEQSHNMSIQQGGSRTMLKVNREKPAISRHLVYCIAISAGVTI